jgi:hypothetical protein
MAVLIVGFIVQLILGNFPALFLYESLLGNQIALYALFNTEAVLAVRIIRWILTIVFPPFNFSKCYVDIATKASDVYDAAKGNSSFSEFSQNFQTNMFPVRASNGAISMTNK